MYTLLGSINVQNFKPKYRFCKCNLKMQFLIFFLKASYMYLELHL
jgi:hypothetical protein